MNNAPALPPLYLFTSLAVMVLLNLFVPVHTVVPYPANAIGLIPLATGMIFNLAADSALKRHATTVKPFEDSTTLVTSGVYHYSRNPMYLGMVLILVGVALLMGTITPWFIVPGFAIIIERVFIRPEEERLEKLFGTQWAAYRESVKRWL